MTQLRPSPSGLSAIAALFLGVVVAFLADAVLTIGLNYVYRSIEPGLGLIQLVSAVVSLIIGAIVGGAALIARRSGPIVPFLAAVLAFAAGFFGDLVGFVVYTMLNGASTLAVQLELYFKGYLHITPIGLIVLVITPGVAFLMAAIKHLKTTPPHQAGPYGAPLPPPPGAQPPGAQPPPPPGFQPPYRNP